MKKISRRSFMQIAGVSAAALGLAACGGSSSSTAASTAPASSAAASGSAAADTGFANAPTIKIQMAENQPSSGTMAARAEEFKQRLEEESQGTIQMELYFDALLGDEATVASMIEAGAVEFTRVNLAAMTATDSELGVLTLPYLYRGANHCYDVMHSDVAEELLDHVSNYGMVGLAFFGGSSIDDSFGARCFYGSEPLDTLDKLKGKKIRVQESEIVISMIDALGAVATPMAYGEVFQALQTGVVDAAENDLGSFVLSGHYEVCKYYTQDYHQFSPSIMLMSEKCWNSMTDAQKDLFMDCMEEYMTNSMKDSAEQYEGYRETALASGVTFVDCDNGPFQEACQAVYDKYPEFADYIKRIQAI